MSRWAIPSNLHDSTYSGPACPFHEHAIGSKDGNIIRFQGSHACVRCIAGLTEGRLSLDVKRVSKRYRRRFLEFWSLVHLNDPDECWPWMGLTHSKTKSSYFYFPRHWTSTRQYSAPRIAAWFTWGDIGRLPITHLCETKNCCNPLHIRVRGVPHFYHRRKLQSIDLSFSSRRLHRDTSQFLELSRDATPERYEALQEINADWIRRHTPVPGADLPTID